MKQKVRRISKSAISILLSVMMVVSMFAIGIVAVNAWNYQNTAIIYFDATNWGDQSSNYVYFALLFNSDNERELFRMKRISSDTSSRIYYYEMNNYSGTNSSGGSNLVFFSGDSGWTSDHSGYQNNKGLADIKQYATKYTNTYGADVYNNHIYYYSAASSSNNGNLSLTKSYDAISDANKINGSTAHNTDSVWSYDLKAISSVATTPTGTPATTNATSTAGGKVTVNAAYFNGWDHTSGTGDTTASYTTATYGKAAKSTTATYKVTQVFSGYEFDGWYTSATSTGSTNRVSTSTNYSETVTSARTLYAHFHRANSTVSTAVSPSGAGTAYISSTSTIGTATSVSDIAYGGTVYLKATAGTGYTFSNWKTVSGLSYADSSAATTSATVTANATATAEFTANTYTISKTNPTHAKIKVPATAAYNSSVTPAATTDLGYKISKYKYSTDGSTWTDVTPGSSFTMPASNVTVTAEVTECSTYTVTLNTSGTGSGTVSAKTSAGETVSSGDEVNEGTVVTFTATPANNNAFTGWSGTGSASSISGTDSSKTVTINADTSVTGTFAANLIQLVTYGTGNTASTTPSATTTMNLMESTGYYRSSVKVTSGGASGDTTGTVFTVKRTIGSTTTYAKSGASGNTWWVTDSMPAVTPQHWTSDNTLNKKYRDKLGSSGTQHYVFYDPETNKIWLSSNADGSTGVKVIAKDGSFVDSSPSNPTTSAGWGNTTLTVSKNSGSSWSNGTSANNGYAQTYTLTNAEVESSTTKIKVSTTVSKANYYVYGFDINGCITKKATKNGSAYELTFSPEDIETNISNFIEITPIYMRTDPSLTDPDADPTTIRFYVRSFSGEIKSRWGGELYCYSYGSSTDSNGDWPGQPMVNLGGGTYYMDLPLGTKAITLSNAAADWIHATTLGVDLTVSDTWKTRNEYQCQSYDYDDFQYIYAKPGVGENDEDIIFDFKYKQGDWGKSGLDNFNTLTTSATQSSFPTTLTPSSYSGWEDYTDLYGEPIDLWGTKLTSNYNNNPVRVVVQGYYDTSAANNSYYATTYVVYKPSSTTGSCTYSKVNYTNSSAGYGKKSRSEFLQRTASEMGLTDLEGQPVQITYEYAIYHDVSTAGTKDKDNQYAERADGIWYYSETKPVKGNVIIQYADDAHSAFSDDTFEIDEDNPGTDYDGDPYTVNEGTTTHAKAYFVDNNYGRTSRAVARPTDAPLDVDYDYRTVEWAYTDAYDYYDVKAEESPDGEYTFIGWYKKSGNTYELASTDYTYQMEASANETFAARYVKTPAGQVKLAHKPVATNNSGGTGDRKVWYDVVSSSAPNTSLLPSGTTQEANGAITVPKTYVKYGKNYVLKVKFQVDPDTNSLKHGIYSLDNAITANLLNETGLESHNSVDVDSFALSPSGTTATLNTDYVTFSIPMDRFFKVVAGTESDPEYEFDDSKSLIEVFSDYDRIKNNINITKTVDYDNGDSFTINVQEQYLTDPSDPTTTAWRNYAGKYTVDDGTAETNFTGTISITGGQTIHILDAPAGTVFQISEANVPTAYTYGGVTIDGATATNITQGKQFTMPATGSVDMTFTNNFKPVTDTYVAAYRTATTGNFTEGVTGGTVDNAGSVERTGLPNTSVTAVAAAAKTGYTFKGWYSSLDGADGHRLTTNTSYGPNIVGGQTYYALFQINSYSATAKVVYNDTGSTSSWTEDTNGTVTGVTASVTPTSGTYSTSENFTATVNNTSQKPNYKFVGWYSASGASAVISGSSESGGASLNRTANRTFYALYKRQVKANVTYKVTADGTFSGTVVPGVTVSGQTMKNGDAAYTAGTYVDVDSSTNFTAGTPQYADAGYYEFRGWYKADGTSLGGTYATSAGQSREGDRTFVAVYGPRTYTLTVRVMLTADGTNYTAADGGKTITASKGGSAILTTGATAKSESVHYNDSISFTNGGSTDPRVVGYYNFSDLTASGTNYTLNNGATEVTNPLSITGNANVVLLVQNKYTATAEVLIRNGSAVTDGDDSWASVTPATYYAGDSGNVAFSHTDKTSIGYSFVGWSEGKDSTPEIGTSDPSYAKTASYTRYAIYEPIGYTLTTGIYYGSGATYTAGATQDTDGTTTGTTITPGSSYNYSDTAFDPAIAAADATGRTADQQSRYVLKGYQIDGTWYEAGTVANTALAALRKTDDHTVYAYYQEYYKVTVTDAHRDANTGDSFTNWTTAQTTSTIAFGTTTGVKEIYVPSGSKVTVATGTHSTYTLDSSNPVRSGSATGTTYTSGTSTITADTNLFVRYLKNYHKLTVNVQVNDDGSGYVDQTDSGTNTITATVGGTAKDAAKVLTEYDVAEGASLAFTNANGTGYRFVEYNPATPATTMPASDYAVTAKFIKQYTPNVVVKVDSNNDGTYDGTGDTTPDGNTANVTSKGTAADVGTALTWTATPNTSSYYKFVGWSTDGTEAGIVSASSLPSTLTSNVTYYALFNKETVKVKMYYILSDNDTYDTSSASQSASYATVNSAVEVDVIKGTNTITFGHTNPTGYSFQNVYKNNTGSAVTSASNLTEDTNYYTRFKKDSFNVQIIKRYRDNSTAAVGADVAAYGNAASVNPSSVLYGGSTELSATAGSDCNFIGFYTNEACTTSAGTHDSSNKLTKENITSAQTYYALFEHKPITAQLTILVSNGGSAYAPQGSGVTNSAKVNNETATGNATASVSLPYNSSTTVTYDSATPASGYTFKGFVTDSAPDASATGTDTVSVTSGTSNIHYYALFKQDGYALTTAVRYGTAATYSDSASTDSTGTVTGRTIVGNPTTYTYDPGNATVTITDNSTDEQKARYKFMGWVVDGTWHAKTDSAYGEDYIVNVAKTGNHTVYAYYQKYFKVTVTDAHRDANTGDSFTNWTTAQTTSTIAFGTTTGVKEIYVPSGSKVTVATGTHSTYTLDSSNPVRSGSATGTTYTSGTSAITEDTNLYVRYLKNYHRLTVNVQVNDDGSGYVDQTASGTNTITATVGGTAKAAAKVSTQYDVAEGASLAFANANGTGYRFVEYDPATPATTMPASDYAVTAKFIKQYTPNVVVKVDSNNDGTYDGAGDTNPDGNTANVTHMGTAADVGTALTWTATPNTSSYYKFVGWSTDGTEAGIVSASSLPSTLTSNVTYYALFNKETVKVKMYYILSDNDTYDTASALQNASYATVNSAVEVDVIKGTNTITFGHTNPTGYSFQNVYKDNTGSAVTSASNLTEDTNYYTRFKKNSFNVQIIKRYRDNSTATVGADVAAYGNAASVNPSSVLYGGSTELSATAGSDCNFIGFYTNEACTTSAGTPDSNNKLTKENITSAQTYYALFEHKPITAQLTILVSNGGSAYAPQGSGVTNSAKVNNETATGNATASVSIPYNSSTTVTYDSATPASGYTFKGFVTDSAPDASATGTNTVSVTSGTSNIHYYALFKQDGYALTTAVRYGTAAEFSDSASTDSDGSVTGRTIVGNPTTYTYDPGNATVTITDNSTDEQKARYKFMGWVVDGTWHEKTDSAYGENYTVNVAKTGNHTVYAYYQKYFKVTVTDSYSDNNGTSFSDFATTNSTMTSGTYGTTVKEIYVPTGTKIAVNTGSHTDEQYHIDATNPVRVGSATSTTIFTSNSTEITADTNLYVRYLKDQVRANAQAVFANTTSDTWTTDVPTGFTAPTFTWNDSYTAGTDVNYDSAKTFQPTVSATTLTDSSGNRYVFKGWYLNDQSHPQNNTTATATAVARTSSPTFYALFTKQVKVTIQVQTDDATPGTFVNDDTTNNNATINGSSTNNNITVYVDYGATVTASQTAAATPVAYTAVGIVYSNGNEWTTADTFTADTTIYARFSLAAVDKSLTITKKLTGDTTDANTEFTVVVTVEGNPYTGSYTDASATDHASSTGTFTLKQNESIVLKELHDGETVVVNETSIPFNYSYAKSTLGNADDTPVDNVSPKGYQYTVSENVDLKIWNSKINYTYALTYAYTSYRSLYNTQKYKVNNSITDEDITKYFKEGSIVDSNNRTVTAYVFKDDAARAAFINHYAPFEDNYMTTLKWNTNMKSDTETTGVSIKYFSSSHEYWIDVNPIENQQKFVDFKMLLPYEHYDEPQQNYDPISDASGNVIYDDEQTVISIDNLDYKSWFATNGVKKYGTSDGDPRFVTAPEKVIDNGTTKYFRYWSVRTIPNDTNPNYVEYTKCYSREFNLAIFQATQVEPIYTELTAEEVSNGYTPNPHSEALKNANGATITFVENSRNQYNKNQSGENIPASRAEQGDRIFTDFLMSFANPEDIQYKTFADNTYTAGLLIERCAELDKDGEGKYYTKSEAQYQAQYGATISSELEATLKDYVDGARSNKADKATVGYGYQYQKVEFDANKLDNKNRIEYYFSMAVRNHQGEFVDNGAKNYVYRAYSYIKDKDGNVKLFSAPLYFTIYDMASIANAEAVAP